MKSIPGISRGKKVPGMSNGKNIPGISGKQKSVSYGNGTIKKMTKKPKFM